MSATPHAGWAVAHNQLAPAFAAIRQRVAQVRLEAGAAAPALTEEQYGAFLQQQTTMISESARHLMAAAARLSEAVNAYDPDIPGTTEPIVRACRDFLQGPAAVVNWAEAIWRTTPPLSFSGSFAALREIPAAILQQLEPFFQTVADAAEGRVTTSRKIDIDIQPLIDRAARVGQGELGTVGTSKHGCLHWAVVIFLVVVAGMILLAIQYSRID